MNYDNYYPIHTSLILEKTKLITWSNKTMELSTSTFWVESSWYFLLNQILKFELYYQNTWMTEQTVIDNLLNNNFLLNANRLTLINVYYSYFSKCRTVVLSNPNSNNIASVDRVFKNCNWLEREASEMYGLNFLFKTDSRKLLLDYSKVEHPLLKDFPTESFKDVFYDILDNQIVYQNNETTEL